MTPPARMRRTLVTLAISMTFTAGLLGWIEPRPPIGSSQPTKAELRSLAQRVVTDDLLVRPGRWLDVVVTSAPDVRQRQGRLLAAASTAPEAHFQLDAAGRPHRVRLWSAQQSLDGSPQTVHIQVLGDGHATEAQQVGLHTLLDVLQEVTAIDSTPLPVLSTVDSAR